MKYLALVFLFFSTYTFAESDRDYKFIYSPSISIGSFDDPNGETDVGNSVSLISIGASLEVGRNKRLIGFISRNEFDIDATETNVGQKIDGYDVEGGYQWQFPIARNLKPWLGLGMYAGNYSSTGRHLVDSNGFLTQTFEDRELSDYGITLNAATEIETDLFNFYLGGGYYQTLNKGFSGARFQLGVLF